MGGGRPFLVLAGVAIACIAHTSRGDAEELCVASAAGTGDGSGGGVGSGDGASCPADMVEIEGDFCPTVEQTCIRRPKAMSYRCLEYARTRCLSTTTTHKHYCIDKYEWPNKKGEMPVVMRDWYEARDACKAVGKRLCTEDEWTLACEGPERLPYPYGQSRDATACNIDKDHPTVDERALQRPDKRDAEVARLWQGEPSGSRDRCVSPFGVHDMTGNVDEWTLNETGKPFNSALKGGYWSWVRGRCRAVTPGHEESFKYYQIGWRCCADAAGGGDGSSGGSGTAIARAATKSAGGAGTTASTPSTASMPSTPSTTPSTASTAASGPASASVAGSRAGSSAASVLGSGSASAAPPALAPAVARAPAPPPLPDPPAAPTAALAPSHAPPAPPAPAAAETGTIAVPARAAGHRIFLDGRVLGPHRPIVTVACGRHVVRLGHDGRDQDVDVPCGGRVAVSYP